jgi:hypothetical protein
MYALVENGSIIKYLNGNKGLTIGDNQYPKSIFTLWSDAERVAIGVYPVRIDTTNKRDEEYYINTNITYAVSGNEVVGSYGTPTAKPLDDVLFTQADADADEIPEGIAVGDVKQYGLKGQKISIIKQQAGGLLAPTDWHVVKATEVADYSVPTDIATYRANVRAKSNEMEDQINACGTVEDLKVLYTYTEDQNGVFSRPLVEWPEEVV